MLDLSFVRANLELVREGLRKRGLDAEALLGDFAGRDAIRRERITEVEQLKAQRNKLAEETGKLKKAGQDASSLMKETRALKEKTEALEKLAVESEEALRAILVRIPNLTQKSVPAGKSEAENVEIKRWGRQPEFNFPPKPHWELGETLGVLDLARAAKVSGARFAVYWGDGARLERALANFMLDIHVSIHGYTEVMPPLVVNSKSLYGTGQLPKFAQDLFRCADFEDHREASEGCCAGSEVKDTSLLRENDHWLIPTAEVPVTNLYRDEVLEEKQLPRSLAAYTSCFRSEAGSYGKDVRGIIRQHQFQKVELVKFVVPEHSDAEHEKLTEDAEAILERLGLPYRRMLLCAGDTGFSSSKTYDLEVWLPGQGVYREISSCSNFEAFQARRANIRFRALGKNKTEFLHTINGSGLAVGRTWLAILENYQQEDGTIKVPEALIPYMCGRSTIDAPVFETRKAK